MQGETCIPTTLSIVVLESQTVDLATIRFAEDAFLVEQIPGFGDFEAALGFGVQGGNSAGIEGQVGLGRSAWLAFGPLDLEGLIEGASEALLEERGIGAAALGKSFAIESGARQSSGRIAANAFGDVVGAINADGIAIDEDRESDFFRRGGTGRGFVCPDNLGNDLGEFVPGHPFIE